MEKVFKFFVFELKIFKPSIKDGLKKIKLFMIFRSKLVFFIGIFCLIKSIFGVIAIALIHEQMSTIHAFFTSSV